MFLFTNDCQMTNVFNMLDHLLTNMIYTVMQTYKPKGQWNLSVLLGSQGISYCNESKSPKTVTLVVTEYPYLCEMFLLNMSNMNNFFSISSIFKWAVPCLSKFWYNITRQRLVYQLSFNYPCYLLVHMTYGMI